MAKLDDFDGHSADDDFDQGEQLDSPDLGNWEKADKRKQNLQRRRQARERIEQLKEKRRLRDELDYLDDKWQ